MRENFQQILEKLNKRSALLIVLFLIIGVNAALYISSESKPFKEIQSRKATSGFSHDKAHRFFYFFYYTGYFPLASLNGNLEYSKEGALKEIQENGDSLIMEYQHWSRLGEHARIFAYMPNAILKGSAKNPSIKLFNAIVFTLSLLILYWGFWKVEKPFWGLFLVALINATPFFLFEVYSRQNIFGLLASTFFIVLGVNLQVLLGKTKRLHLLILLSIISGVIIGFFSEIRNEVVIVGVSVLLLYLLSNQYNVVKRLLLALILLVSLLITRHLVRVYFELKFEETKQLVTAHGGHVYCGERIAGHKFWHPVFCGLGDFDTKYGYEWDDRIAYKFAVPILREKYGINVNYSGKYYTDDYYDDAKLYYIKFDEIPEYEQVVKEKVLGNITSDPVWYFTIIIKRIGRVLTRTIPFRYVGWLLFPLILFLIFKKRWDSLKIILISLPLSATSIIIFSGSGATFNSVFAYFVLAIVVYELLQFYTLGFNLKSAAFPFEDSLTSE